MLPSQLGKPASAAKIVAQNKEELHWINTLAFDNRGKCLSQATSWRPPSTKATDFTKINILMILKEFYAKAAEATASGPGIAQNSSHLS